MNTPSARRAWTVLAVTIVATVVAMLVDKAVFTALNAPDVYATDMGRLLRIMGFAGTWLALALAVGLTTADDAASRAVARRRGWLLFWSPMLSGAIAELLKIVVRRQRPEINAGDYGFRAWGERTWNGAGLSFPSSHTAVAFGGAAMLAQLFPRARWIGYLLAAGCGLTRIFARAHFLSDVVFAAGLGWLVSWALWKKFALRPVPLAVLVATLAPLLLAPGELDAQNAETQAARPDRPCGYAACALNVVPVWNGLAIVRGEAETHVATLGFFWPGSLAGVFTGNDTAVQLGRQATATRTIAALLTDVGIALMAAGALRASGDAGADQTARVFLGVGAVSLGISAPLQFRADGLMTRATWHYNSRFAR